MKAETIIPHVHALLTTNDHGQAYFELIVERHWIDENKILVKFQSLPEEVWHMGQDIYGIKQINKAPIKDDFISKRPFMLKHKAGIISQVKRLSYQELLELVKKVDELKKNP